MQITIEKKKKSFKELSSKKCEYPGCKKFLKTNLVERNPDANYCYSHHLVMIGKVREELPVVCPECGGNGDLIDQKRITSMSIDIPTKKCGECGGSGFKNN